MTTFLYNPDRKPKNELIAEFVVRTEIYNEIMGDLEASKMQHPEQHYLLVGQRGSGKTTILNRLKYGIEDSPRLQNNTIPMLFSEEQYNISELVNLWETVSQNLEDYWGFDNLYTEIEGNSEKSNFEEIAFDILVKHLKQQKKKVVLLIDNIGDMLKKLEKIEIHRFREILQTNSEIRLIACSPFYPETLLDYHQPLFEFFKVLHLDNLNQSETQLLLLKLAEINNETNKIKKIVEETPERIETLRTLTGGIPRTIALMFKIFIEFNNEDVVKDLEKLLDAVTPLYKHKMDDLPTQQQKIVDAVAKNWDGISVKELVEKLRIESKVISAQLRQLQKNQIIDVVNTSTKNHIYFLRERFFNIWYLMRYGRKYDKQRVIWLVKFLESWCSAVEIEQRILDFARKIKDGALDENLVNFYGEVYIAMDNMRSEIKIMLKELTPKNLSNRIVVDDSELIRISEEEINNNNLQQAIKLLKQIQKPENILSQEVIKQLSLIIDKDTNYYSEFSLKLKSKLEKGKNAEIRVELFDFAVLLSSFIFIIVLSLTEKEFENAHNQLKTLVEAVKLLEETLGIDKSALNYIVEFAIIQFLLHSQPNTVLSVIEKNSSWKDRVKPFYFATLKFAGKEDEFLKMGSEIEPFVNRLIKLIYDRMPNFNT